MLLEGQTLEKYLPEMRALFERELGEKLQVDFATFFGVFDRDVLQAAASTKCYYGHWYMRADVVKPEFRGRGLQRILIRERLLFLRDKASEVKASIEPWNEHSRNNYLAEGFEVWKRKKLADGRVVDIYKKVL